MTFKRIRIKKSSPKTEKAFQWKPPPSSIFKLNVDGAVFAKIQKAGVGAIFRDKVGNVIMAMTKLESGVDSADDIEAIAALKALQMVLHIGVSSIILEGVSMWVVEALKSSGTNMSRQGPLFEEIKGLLNHFINFEVYHVGREGNATAHVLTRHAQCVDDIVVWWHSTPVLIKQYVSVDIMLDSQ
ncbi:hypothetical protein AAC387_Pa09g0995 [Persea americana]